MEQNEKSSLLDGTETIPDQVQISQLLKARATEIQALENAISQTTGTKLIFQRLPKHMRRRTMSHNVKRLPRRLHGAHMRQMLKSGLPPKQKRPSRKFRRRPKNIQADYNRRKRRVAWLETHIWHAKRFHMTERWGYKIPERPCDKAFRACYRASAKHCLLQDISYYNCIELKGPEDLLIAQLKGVTNCTTGLTITAQAFRKGTREGTAMFFRNGSYPYGAVGEVKFMWKPPEDKSDRQLWLWVHPAFCQEITECLIELFSLKPTAHSVYENSVGIKMTDLKQALNRFRLTGPLSQSVLLKSLSPVTETNTSTWFTTYLQTNENKISLNEQTSFWTSLHNISSSSNLHPHLILNLTITDSRYNFPCKRTKAKEELAEYGDVPDLSDGLKFGAIWSEEVRASVSQNVSTTAVLLNQIKNQLVPDGKAPDDATALPVMLIQQPGNRDSLNHLGYCSGWDVIAPLNWGRPLWVSFIMWGARAGGLRESVSLRFESGQPDFLPPDTKSGRAEEDRVSNLYTQHFFNRPPNRRPNYNKLGIISPFGFPWLKLIQEWKSTSNIVEEFYVMRDRQKLEMLQQKLKTVGFQVDVDFSENCLIPVKLTMLRRGCAGRYSIICLAEDQDLKNKSGPTEPFHNDENQITRKNIRDAHQKLLKKLRHQRIKAKEEGKQISSNKNIIEEHAAKMKSLWLPEPKTIRNSCSRQVFGFVTNGDFCFSSGNGSSIGYITIGALPALFSKQKNLVLVRSISSRQYRLARIDVIIV